MVLIAYSDSRFGAPLDAEPLAMLEYLCLCKSAIGATCANREAMPVNEDSLANVRWGRLQGETVWRPPTDVYETDDAVVVRIEIAGLREGDYQVSLVGRVLEVSGERRDPAEKLAYQQMEIRYGKFRTQVHLSWPLDPTGQAAIYQEGFLRIVLQKALPRRVPVRVIHDREAAAHE